VNGRPSLCGRILKIACAKTNFVSRTATFKSYRDMPAGLIKEPMKAAVLTATVGRRANGTDKNTKEKGASRLPEERVEQAAAALQRPNRRAEIMARADLRGPAHCGYSPQTRATSAMNLRREAAPRVLSPHRPTPRLTGLCANRKCTRCSRDHAAKAPTIAMRNSACKFNAFSLEKIRSQLAQEPSSCEGNLWPARSAGKQPCPLGRNFARKQCETETLAEQRCDAIAYLAPATLDANRQRVPAQEFFCRPVFAFLARHGIVVGTANYFSFSTG